MLESGSVDKGLSHYLSGQCSLSEAVYATESSRLHILFAGPVPPNPTELLSGELFKDTLNSFRDIYDYIFIDWRSRWNGYRCCNCGKMHRMLQL